MSTDSLDLTVVTEVASPPTPHRLLAKLSQTYRVLGEVVSSTYFGWSGEHAKQ